MMSVVNSLVLFVMTMAQMSLAERHIDPCYIPESIECLDELENIRKEELKFQMEFNKETDEVLEEFIKRNPNLKGVELNNSIITNEELKKKLIDILVSKGLEKVARALRSHEKKIQLSFDLLPDQLERQLWKTNNLLEALEILIQKPDDLTKFNLFNIYSDVTNARVIAEYYVEKLSGKDADRVKDNIERIKKIEKKIDEKITSILSQENPVPSL